VKKAVVVGIVLAAGVLAVLIYSTMTLAKYRVEVCIAYNGQTSCRTASADTQEHAMRAATDNACALIASGVTETLGCTRSEPTSVRWLKGR
jgi:hypothetical protein